MKSAIKEKETSRRKLEGAKQDLAKVRDEAQYLASERNALQTELQKKQEHVALELTNVTESENVMHKIKTLNASIRKKDEEICSIQEMAKEKEIVLCEATQEVQKLSTRVAQLQKDKLLSVRKCAQARKEIVRLFQLSSAQAHAESERYLQELQV